MLTPSLVGKKKRKEEKEKLKKTHSPTQSCLQHRKKTDQDY